MEQGEREEKKEEEHNEDDTQQPRHTVEERDKQWEEGMNILGVKGAVLTIKRVVFCSDNKELIATVKV